MNSVIQKLSSLILVAVGALLFEHERLEAAIILMDGMSNPSNYTSTALNGTSSMSNLDDESFLEPLTGNASVGNPGAWIGLTHNHNVARNLGGAPLNANGNTFLQSLVREQVFSFIPSVSGPIQDISFSLDINLPVSVGTVLFQQIFFTVNSPSVGNAAGFTNITSQTGWQTITVSGLTNADFSSQDFSGSNSLSFGFGFTSSGDVTLGPQSVNIGVDNFVVNINSIPEPSSLLLAGSALLVMVRLRRTYEG